MYISVLDRYILNSRFAWKYLKIQIKLLYRILEHACQSDFKIPPEFLGCKYKIYNPDKAVFVVVGKRGGFIASTACAPITSFIVHLFMYVAKYVRHAFRFAY